VAASSKYTTDRPSGISGQRGSSGSRVEATRVRSARAGKRVIAGDRTWLPYAGDVRAVVQRVTRAEVRVGDEVVGAIGSGLLVLVGVTGEDTERDADLVASKLVGLRILPDDAEAMNRSVQEAGGAVLVVSQFTLYADTRRGRRPSFTTAAQPRVAEPLIERVVEGVRQAGIEVQSGRFGAKMDVELVNDGPVTVLIETRRGGLV
jgi:D-tyrosyl-tRNA(Tyr) deacylase